MEVKRICQWCGKPFMAKKTTTNYCSPQCSKRGYKHRMKERRMEMREFQEMLEVKNKLESQEYFTFSQAARLMGVSRQYVYKLVKEDKLRASRLSSRMSLIRRGESTKGVTNGVRNEVFIFIHHFRFRNSPEYLTCVSFL